MFKILTRAFKKGIIKRLNNLIYSILQNINEVNRQILKYHPKERTEF